VCRGGCRRHAHHLADTGAQQGVPCSGHGGPGGDHIIHQQHPQVLRHLPGTELGALQPLGARVAGLLLAVAAVQQAPARHAQLVSDRPGQQLGLVVPTGTGARTAGGRPRDDIDPADLQPTGDERGQHLGHRPAVAVLEAVHDLAGHPLERQGREHATIAHLGFRAGEREAAAMAEHDTRLVAAGAGTGEHHGARSTRRVSQGFR